MQMMQSQMQQSNVTLIGQNVSVTDNNIQSQNQHNINQINTDAQTQQTIANIYGQMKTLESKYIDLANYYKQELSLSSQQNIQKNHSTNEFLDVQTMLSQNSQIMHHNSQPSSSSSKSAVSGVISIQQRDIQAQNLHSGQINQQNSNQIFHEQTTGSIHQSSQQFSSSNFPQSVQLSQEDIIISDLKKEQNKLEQKMSLLMQAHNLGKSQENIINQDDFQNNQFNLNTENQANQQKVITLQDNEIIRFNNELQGVFKDLLDHVDHSQLQTANTMGQRQSEMFQLSVKYRMPSGFKNDAIGVWYDAKTDIIQYIAKLKQFIQEKGISLMAQTFKPSQSFSSNTQDNQQFKQDYFKLIETFEEDMVNLKKKSKEFNKSIQKLKVAIKSHDDSINQDKNILKNVYSEIQDAILSTNDLVLGRNFSNDGQNYQDFNGIQQQNFGENINSLTINSQGSANIQMSPFDKRVNAYSKNAINRSNSRGISSASGGIQKPPKISQIAFQQNQNNQRQLGPNNFAKNLSNEQQDLHPNLRLINQRVLDYHQTISQLMSEVNEKNQKLEEISKRVDEQVNENLMKFLQTHDTDIVKQYFTNTILTPTETAQILAKANLQAHQKSTMTGAVKNYQQVSSSSNAKKTPKQSISPYRQNRKSASREPSNGNAQQFRKTTPTRQKNIHPGTSTSASRTGGITSSHGQTPSRDFGNYKLNNSNIQESFKQTQNTEHLFKELKKQNEKCMEYQVENRKLKDQVQVCSLQLEDLRIHNNRYQIQIQNYQKQINQFRINNTKTARVTPGNLSVQEIQSPTHRLYGDGQHPIGQAYSSTTYSHDKEEILAEEQELCKRIDQFFTAMKLLQKAVNRKEDISELKVEFETKQRALQKLSKQIQVRINGSKMQSHHNNQDQNRVDNSENLAKKVQNQNLRNRSQSTRAQQASASRPQAPASSSHRLPSSPLKSKQNTLNQQIIRNSSKTQAGPPQNQLKSPKPFNGLNNQDVTNHSESRNQIQNQNQQSIVYDEIFIQENHVVEAIQPKQFLTQSNNIQQNKQNLNLQDQNEVLQYKKQIKELNQFLNTVNGQKNQLISIVQGHQKALFQVSNALNSGKNNMNQSQLEYINDIFNSLLRELDLSLQHFGTKNVQTQNTDQLNQIKKKLEEKIGNFEQNLIQKYNEVQLRLAQREEQLDSLKKLFLEKLRVLESNFSEIGDHMIANQVQQENEAQKQQKQEQESNSVLKQYLTDTDMQEQDEKQLEELINTNNQLYDQINQLKRQYKDYIEPQIHQQVVENLRQVEEKLQKIQIENGSKLSKAYDNLLKDKVQQQDDYQKLKIEKNNLQLEFQKNVQQQMNFKLEQEKKDMLIEQKIKEIQQNLKDEIEQKICAQKEAKEKSQLFQQIEIIANQKELQIIEKEKILSIFEDENDSLKIELQEEIKTSKKLKSMFDEEIEDLENKKQEALKLKNDTEDEFKAYKQISEKHINELEGQISQLKEEAEKQKAKQIQQMEIEKVETSQKWNLLQQKIQIIEEQKIQEKQKLEAEIISKNNSNQKIEEEMEVLRQQKQKYDEIQNQIKQLENISSVLEKQCSDKENQLQEQIAQNQQLQEKYNNYLKESEQKISILDNQLRQCQNQVESLNNQLEVNNEKFIYIENELNLLKDVENQLQEKLKLQEENILSLNGQIEQKSQKLLTEEQQNKKLQKIIEDYQNDQQNIDLLKTRITELEQVIEENIESINNYKDQKNEFQDQQNLIQQNLENIQNQNALQIQDLIQKNEILQKEIDDLKQKQQSIEQQYTADMKKDKEEQDQIIEELKKQNENLQNKINYIENQLQTNQNAIQNQLLIEQKQQEQTIIMLETQIEKMIEDYKNQQELFEKQIEIEKQQTLQNFVDEMKIKTDQLQNYENQVQELVLNNETIQEKNQSLLSQIESQKLSIDNFKSQQIQNDTILSQIEGHKQTIENLQDFQNQNNILLSQIESYKQTIDNLQNLQIQNESLLSQIENLQKTIEKLENENEILINQKQELQDLKASLQDQDEYEQIIVNLKLQIQQKSEEYEISKNEMQDEILQLKESQKKVNELILDLDKLQKNQQEEKLENEELKTEIENEKSIRKNLEFELSDIKLKLNEKEQNEIELQQKSEGFKKQKTELDTEIIKLKMEKQMIKNDLETKLRLQRDATAELINDLEVKAKLKEEQLEQMAHSMFGQRPPLSNRSKNNGMQQESEIEQERQNMIQVVQDLRLQLEKERQESNKLKNQLKENDKQLSSRR